MDKTAPLLAGADPEASDQKASKDDMKVSKFVVLLVFMTLFLDTLSSSISGPALPFLAKRDGASDFQVGWLYSIASLMSLVAGPIIAYLGDNIFGRRTILWVSLLGAGVASLVQGLAVNYWMLFAGRAFGGIWTAVSITVSAYILDVCPEKGPNASRYYLGYKSAMSNIANIFGPGIGGVLTTFSLQTPMLMDAAVNLIGAIMVFIFVPEPPVKTKKKKKESGANATGGVPMAVNAIGSTSFMNNIAKSTVSSMFAVFALQWFGMSAFDVGQASLVIAFCEIISVLFVVQPIITKVEEWLSADFFKCTLEENQQKDVLARLKDVASNLEDQHGIKLKSLDKAPDEMKKEFKHKGLLVRDKDGKDIWKEPIKSSNAEEEDKPEYISLSAIPSAKFPIEVRVTSTKSALFQVNVWGTALMATGLLTIVLAPNSYLFVACFALSRFGQTFRNATGDTILMYYMTDSNKATVMTRQNTFSQCGKLLGPLAMGNLASGENTQILVWPLASCMSYVSAFIYLIIWMRY